MFITFSSQRPTTCRPTHRHRTNDRHRPAVLKLFQRVSRRGVRRWARTSSGLSRHWLSLDPQFLLRLFTGKRINGGTLLTGALLSWADHSWRFRDSKVRDSQRTLKTNSQTTSLNCNRMHPSHASMNRSVKYGWRCRPRTIFKRPSPSSINTRELVKTPNAFDPPLICIAAAGCSDDILKLLLTLNPTSVAVRDRDGKNALHYATRYPVSRNAELLLSGDQKSGIKAHPELATQPDQRGRLPIHEAIDCGALDALDLLASRFPETVAFQDSDGRTALHYAVEKNAFLSVRSLCKAAEDDPRIFRRLLALKDRSGATPLDLARHNVTEHPLDEDAKDINQLLQDLDRNLSKASTWLPRLQHVRALSALTFSRRKR